MVATVPGDYGSAHLLMTFHGLLPGGESWSIGIRTEAASPPDADLANYSNYAAAVFHDYAFKPVDGLGISSVNPSTVTFVGCLLRKLTIAGVTISQAEADMWGDAAAGSAQSAPNQTALALTLKTALPGRHGKGRVYIPLLQPGALTNGRIAAGFTAGLALSFGLFLENLRTIDAAKVVKPASLFLPCVQSRTSHLPGAPITAVSVGDVPDTMRRRRFKMREQYSDHPLLALA